MKIAFGTVIYKESFKFYLDFVDSINNQLYKDFDTIILNDDLGKDDLQLVSNSFNNNIIFWNGKVNSEPFELRVELINKAKLNNYDLLILGDFDDQFSKDRILTIVEEFEENFAFYYNDIYYFDQKREFISNMPKYTCNIYDILESNYLGLSNTALNLAKIDFDLIDELRECSTAIFDWCMYSILLNKGLKGKKVENCRTYYRMHLANIAGKRKVDYVSILEEIAIKLKHYSILSEKNLEFSKRYDRYLKIKTYIEKNDLNEIIKYIEDNEFWWSGINSNNHKWRALYEI